MDSYDNDLFLMLDDDLFFPDDDDVHEEVEDAG